MMKKTIFIFLAVMGIIVVGIFTIRLLSDEDDWICVDGKWVKHGYPSAPMPTSGCGEKKEVK